MEGGGHNQEEEEREKEGNVYGWGCINQLPAS